MLERSIAIIALAILVGMNVILPTWKLGPFPARGILAVGVLVMLSLFYAETMVAVAKKFRSVIQLGIALALLGTFVSILNGATFDAISEALIEIHLQVLVTLLLAGVIAKICGTRACVLVLVGVVAVSAGFAIMQAMGVHEAWNIRSSLGAMQAQAKEVSQFEKPRPTGLSYSPIQLSTQLCLAFAAFAAWRESRRFETGRGKTQDPILVAALIAFIIICVASQTRAPIAGALVFFALYSISRRGSLVPVMLMASAALIYFLWPSLTAMVQTPPPRVTRVDDDTVWNRLTLATYGFKLLVDNPIGYGFTFNPSDYWETHWRDLYVLPGARAVQSKELHNYFLNMLDTYGIGILLVAPMVAGMLWRSKAWLIFFVPYLLHITFHNVGPFWNDSFVWFAIAALSPLAVADAAPQYARIRRRYGGAWQGLTPTVGAADMPPPTVPDPLSRQGRRPLRPLSKRFSA